jgi:hypothetical protein
MAPGIYVNIDAGLCKALTDVARELAARPERVPTWYVARPSDRLIMEVRDFG